MSLSKQFFFGLTLFFILPLLLGGCEKYKEIEGAFVSYSFRNQIQINLKDNDYVPNYIKIAVLDRDEIKKFLNETKIDVSDFSIENHFNEQNLYMIAYGWGVEPAMQQNEFRFNKSYISHKKIWTPFDENDFHSPSRKLFTYSHGFDQGASVTEFIDLYVFKKDDLINYQTNQIELGYRFRYKATYDFEKEQRWGEVTGNIQFDVPSENAAFLR